MEIRVERGCKPRFAPKIFGSKILLIMFVIKNIIIIPIAKLRLLLTKNIIAKGIKIIPEPTKGIESKKLTIAAVPIGLFNLIIKNPIVKRIKLISIKNRYALKYFITVFIVNPFVLNKKFWIFFGKRFVMVFVILS